MMYQLGLLVGSLSTLFAQLFYWNLLNCPINTGAMFFTTPGLTNIINGDSSSVCRVTRQVMRSKTDCAIHCHQSGDCVAFRFDTSGRVCVMSTGGLSNSGGSIYIPKKYKCPADKGYMLWLYPSMEFCVKYNTTIVNNSVAKQACEDDGGHLLLIESNEMRLRIVTSLAQMNVAGSVHFDGNNLPNNTIIASSGQLLTWVGWAGGNPGEPVERCLRGTSQDAFLTRDTRCWTQHKSICQIDL